MTRFFYSLTTFCFGIFFIFFGALGVIFPYSQTIRNEAVSLLSEHSAFLLFLGFSAILLGVSLLINILIHSKRKYIHLTIKGSNISVDETAIEHYLAIYWKELFPNEEIPCYLAFKNEQIYITADLPFTEMENQKAYVEKIQTELRSMLSKTIGYTAPFHLSISFDTKNYEKSYGAPEQTN